MTRLDDRGTSLLLVRLLQGMEVGDYSGGIGEALGSGYRRHRPKGVARYGHDVTTT